MKKLPEKLEKLLENSYQKTWDEKSGTNVKQLRLYQKEIDFADMFGYDMRKHKEQYNNHAFFLGYDMYSTEECGE